VSPKRKAKKRKLKPRMAISLNSPHHRSLLGLRAGMRLLVAALCCSTILAAQNHKKSEVKFALLFVNAYDADGHPLYGANVKVRRLGEKKTRWEGPTNHSGEFAQRLPLGPSDYLVWLETGNKHADGEAIRNAEKGLPHSIHEGAVSAVSAVKIHIESDERIDLGLHLKQ